MARLIFGFLALCLLCIYVSAEECGLNEVWERCAKRCEKNCGSLFKLPVCGNRPRCAYECGCKPGYRRTSKTGGCALRCPF